MLARPAGFEPATTRLEGGCSIQLSYGRRMHMFNPEGLKCWSLIAFQTDFVVFVKRGE